MLAGWVCLDLVKNMKFMIEEEVEHEDYQQSCSSQKLIIFFKFIYLF